MNRSFFCSAVLVSLFLSQGAWGFRQCNSSPAYQSSIDVSVYNNTGRPLLAYVLFSHTADDGEAKSTAVGIPGVNKDEQAGQSVSGSANVTFLSAMSGTNVPAVAVIPPNTSDYVVVHAASAYCSNSNGNTEGTFGFQINVDGITMLMQSGSSADSGNIYPDTYYDPDQFTPTSADVIVANGPVYNNPDSSPPGLGGSPVHMSQWVPYGLPAGSVSPWLVSYPQGMSSFADSSIKWVFLISQRNPGYSYPSCSSSTPNMQSGTPVYQMGPLCYQYQGGYQEWGDTASGPQQLNDIMTIVVNDPNPINVQRTQINPFAPSSYDPPASGS